jgi:hypothetical protein
MTGIWWTSVSIEIFLCSLTATTAHLLMSLGQTLFHRYLGHRGIGGRFFPAHMRVRAVGAGGEDDALRALMDSPDRITTPVTRWFSWRRSRLVL